MDPLGLSSRQLWEHLSLPPSTLNYWVQIGLARPSLRRPQGKRVEQYWSIADVVIVRTVRALRQSGASLQQVRRASKQLAKMGDSLSSARLLWDGTRIIALEDDGAGIDLTSQPGQRMWMVVALPLTEWFAEARGAGRPVPVDLLAKRDQMRARQVRKRGEGIAPLEGPDTEAGTG